MAFSSTEKRGRSQLTAAFVGWAALLLVVLCLAPYLYAANDLIQWR